MVRAATLVIACSVLAGCSMGPVDLADKRCPCAPGWVCDARDLCVRGSLDGVDAGPDGGEGRDAEARDAEPRDASALDASEDSGLEDGGDRDAGIDAATDAATDAGPDDTACDDALSGAFVCDGFEVPFTSAWDFVEEMDGTVDRVSSPTYRGGFALRGRTTAARGRAAVANGIPAVSSGDLWLRGYFYLPSTFDLRGVALIYAHEPSSPYDGVSAGFLEGGVPYAWVGSNPGTTTFAGSGPVPRDRWFCMQVHVVVSDGAGSIEVLMDGATVLSQTGLDTRPAGDYTGFVAGLERADTLQTTAAMVYADEVAVGASELPCD